MFVLFLKWMFLIWLLLIIFLVCFLSKKVIFCFFNLFCSRCFVVVLSWCFIRYGVRWMIDMFMLRFSSLCVVFKLSSFLLMMVVFLYCFDVVSIVFVFFMFWKVVMFFLFVFGIGRIKGIEFVVRINLL